MVERGVRDYPTSCHLARESDYRFPLNATLCVHREVNGTGHVGGNLW
jgi:hypothetical protein